MEDLTAFLKAPLEEMHQVMPATVVFTAGGTRRSAAFSGISPESEAYISWARERLIESAHLLFQHGARHVFIAGMTPDNFLETGTYAQSLIRWTDWAMAGADAMSDYARLGWRVRILGSEDVPALVPAAQRLREGTSSQDGHTLWCLIVPDSEAPWRWVLSAAHREKAYTRQEAVRALYGEDVPSVGLFIATGKPMISTSLIPPLLIDKTQCYWRQRPGHQLTQEELRAILYDYAYVRQTWQADKKGRAEDALQHREIWESAPILGLGQRLGLFWYPQPFSLPPDTAVTD